ncbi:MAG: S8 family serine peptidase [Fuerstiella sp.]
MAKARGKVQPKTFFLNEQHELPPEEKTGGGRASQYEGIDWAAKGHRLHSSLESVQQGLASSRDPLRERRYFMIADPEPRLTRTSKDKRKAPQGTFEEETDFSRDHPRVFSRLGLDLIDVSADGRAIVHATPERMQAILHRTDSLEELGARDRLRWATIREFEQIPVELRVDGEWLNQIRRQKSLVDVVIELQPFLTRVDVEDVMRSLTATLGAERESRLTGTGEDYSGRCWFRGRLSYRSVSKIVRDFYSVQAVHEPLLSVVAAKRHSGRRAAPGGPPRPMMPVVDSLPVVACVDSGVASQHSQLAPYLRGVYVAPRAFGGGNHGTHVASRIVFGDLQWDDVQEEVRGTCRVLSADVASSATTIDEKSVLPTLEAILGAYPDVRVFNLSFSNRLPLSQMDEVKRKERTRLMRDLDNFIFANDVVVVAAGGNTHSGVIPNQPYPNHIEDPQWKLGSWTAGFNVLVCGSYVDSLIPNGLVQEIGWPSPFTRIGPGIAESPVPDFSAPGGNWNDTYNFEPGLGVLSMNPMGLWEDRSGTSLAAPILAREAAWALKIIGENYCLSGSHPFAVTARAFLILTAVRSTYDERIAELSNRTLGVGRASAARLVHPQARSGVMIWQGEINGPKDLMRLNVPIPRAWLNSCVEPQMRLVVCWDPPVNDAIYGVWSCRKVSVHLRPGPDINALRPLRTYSHPSYPVLDRLFRLDRLPKGVSVTGDIWLVDLSYDEIAEYYSPMDFAPMQRVGMAIELMDAANDANSPQEALQALPITTTMTHLSQTGVPVRQPIVVKSNIQ